MINNTTFFHVEYFLAIFQKTYPVLPSEGLAQLRVFNTLDCDVNMTLHDPELSIALKSMDMWQNKFIEVKDRRVKELSYEADFSMCDKAGITELGKISGMSKKDNEKNLTDFKILSCNLQL